MNWYSENKNEFELFELYPGLLSKLLIDNSSSENIIWATNNYIKKGYKETDKIHVKNINGNHKYLITPRINKSKKEQLKRSKDMAEVFTPSWICNKQNNLVDNEWFGYKNVFNVENDNNTWCPTKRVVFNNKNYKDYISDIRLEITCGEAPYLVSRYDSVSGERIDLQNRVGFLDRKFRVIKEYSNKDDWIRDSLTALKSVYAYEFQGDNLLIARENILFTYIDYYYDYFKKKPDKGLLDNVVYIITWNIWQMDGIKMVIPFSCYEKINIKTNIFGEEEIEGIKCPGCENNMIHQHNGIKCLIMDWNINKKIRFLDLLKRF